MSDFNTDIKNRTKKNAINIIKMYSGLNKNDEIRIIGKQIIRSSTSVAVNFRAACRAISENELYLKLCICIEEADETLFWLEVLIEADLIKKEKLKQITEESTEILKILASTRKKTKQKLENNLRN